MKKFFLWILVLFISYLSFAHAQSLWYIETSFCNGEQENQMDIVAKTEQETEICVQFINHSDEDITIDINFVDWALDSLGQKSCGIPEDSNTRFKPFVLDYEKELTIKWHDTIKKTYKIKFPLWYTWISHWCLAYNISEKNPEWSVIHLVARKTHSIDILVWWDEVKSKISINKAYITGNINGYRLAFDIKNIWNIEQRINISWSLSNRFWYEYNYNIKDVLIPAQSSQILLTDDIALPSYKWVFYTRSYLDFTPIFDFDISNNMDSSEYSLPWNAIISNVIFLWNRILVAWVIIIIVLILIITIRIISKRSKKSKK